jgi:hypothetical protein
MSEWLPLKRMDDDPAYERNPSLAALRAKFALGEDDEVWLNLEYQVLVRYLEPMEPGLPSGRDGMMHLSIHKIDRHRVRDWRDLQQIKNEVAGFEREAVELFPRESRLVDTSNEYHLWVMPIGATLPFGFQEGMVSDDRQTARMNETRREGAHKGRQHPWRPGMTTGRNEHNTVIREEAEELYYGHFKPDTDDGG